MRWWVAVLAVLGIIVASWWWFGSEDFVPASSMPDGDSVDATVTSTAISDAAHQVSTDNDESSYVTYRSRRREVVAGADCGRIDADVVGVIAVAPDADKDAGSHGTQLALMMSASYQFVRLLPEAPGAPMTTLCSGRSCFQWDESTRTFRADRGGLYRFVVRCTV